jgi:hypothetical protein
MCEVSILLKIVLIFDFREMASLDQFAMDYSILKNCCYQDYLGDPSMIYQARLNALKKTQENFNQHLLDILNYGMDHSSQKFLLRVDNRSVCSNCFCTRMGISPRTLNRRQNDVRQGKLVWVHGNKGSTGRPHSDKGMVWRAAMLDYFTDGEHDPENGHIELPVTTEDDVYEEIKRDLEVIGEKDHICPSTFRSIWRKEFPHVIIPEKQRLGLCEECVEITDLLRREKDPVKRIQLKQRRSEHRKFFKSQRQKYCQHRLLAEQQPDQYLSIIIDAMDQNKLALPQFHEISKKEDIKDKIKYKLFGVIVHGRVPRVRGYFVDPRFSSDSNMTLEVLIRTLDAIGLQNLPPHIFLQLDNTCSSNKNSM